MYIKIKETTADPSQEETRGSKFQNTAIQSKRKR
jgi:hypothetical protein